MKTRFIAATLIAVLFAGCSKEDIGNTRINILAEGMHHGGAKVLHDPANLNNATWIAGERIDLGGGNVCTITEDENQSGLYYLAGTELLSGNLYAIYPATVSDSLGNDIQVVNGRTGTCGIGMKSLAVTFRKDGSGQFTGKHEVIFPMSAEVNIASADATNKSMLFRHLTGGLKITLSDTTSPAVTVDRLVISATRGSGTPAIYRDLAPMWDCTILPLQPSFPEQHGLTDDQDLGASFISEMTLKMKTRAANGSVTHSVTIPAKGSITFCVPMLAKNLKFIQITGYNGNNKVFQTAKKDIGTETNIERNLMYTIPEIVF